MPHIKSSITFVLIAFLLSFAAVVATQRALRDADDLSPLSLSRIPLQLGDWTGEDSTVGDDINEALNAKRVLNRTYRQQDGREIKFHAAQWANGSQIIPDPHHPDVCYPAAGWSLVERRNLRLDVLENAYPCELILFSKDGVRTVTLHFFVSGQANYSNRSEFESVRRQFWGLRNWPDTIKFLMQTSAPTLDVAAELLVPFATSVVESAAEKVTEAGKPADEIALPQVKSTLTP